MRTHALASAAAIAGMTTLVYHPDANLEHQATAGRGRLARPTRVNNNHLIGVHRPMTAAQIFDHNRNIKPRKARRR